LALWMVVSFTWVTARQEAMTEDAVLAEMDTRAATLRSMRAAIEQRRWTDILEEFDAGEAGSFQFLREGEEIYLRKNITEPQENTLILHEGKVLFYQPKIKQLQKYDLGQRRDRAEFMLLGFGSSKTDLQETYDVRLLGKETIDRHETYQLELSPKSKEVSAYFARIVLWVDTSLWIPIQQKLVEPTGDYILIRFDEVELNPDIAKSEFELKVPKDVTVVGG